MTNEETINQAFNLFSLSLDDLRKIFEADFNGSGPNFIAAGIVMTVTEPIAKTFYPFQRNTLGSTTATRLEDIDAKEAANHFYERCFSNARYGQLSYLIWDGLRNVHVHLYQSKKVINAPLPQYNESFLAGVHWSGSKPSELESNLNQERQERSEHLQFALTTIRGKIRPYFRFSPVIYYLDLCEAVQTFRSMIDSNPLTRQTFLDGYQLLVNAKRMDFNNRLRATEQNLILTEIQKL